MPRRTHEDSLETRKKILSSAQRLFTRRGYERTSLSDVAKYAGVTRGAIYWHFENKEELLAALIDTVDLEQFSLQMLQDAADPEQADPLGKIKSWLSTIVHEEQSKFINSSLMTMIISIMNGASGDNSVRDRLIQTATERHNLLIKAFKNCIVKGQMPKNLVIETAVAHLAMLSVGYIHQSRLNLTEAIEKNFENVIDLEIETIKKITTDNFFV